MTAAEFDRRLVLAFGPMTPAELMAELTLLETIEQAKRQNHQRVVSAAIAEDSGPTRTELVAEAERLTAELNNRDRLLRKAFESGDDAWSVINRDGSWNRWAS